MNSSRQQVERMLAMIPYLQSAMDIPVVDLAREFGVSVPQVTKDLEQLMLTGVGELHGELIDVDFGALEDEGVVRIRDADFMSRPLRVSTREGAALIVALRTLQQTVGGSQRDVIDSALEKLESAMFSSEVSSAVDVQARQVDEQVLEAVNTALREQHQLEITYLNANRDDQTVRTIEPLRLFVASGEQYLRAWCLLADGFRTFRIDRIAVATDTEQQFQPTRSPTQELSESLFEPGSDTPWAILDLSPDAWWMIDYYHAEDVQELSDEIRRVRIFGTDHEWLKRLVMRNARAVRLVEPLELARDVAAGASAALAAYDRS